MKTRRVARHVMGLAAASALLTGLAAGADEREGRKGDEIVVAGTRYHAGTPVVTWTDPGGYDAYRVPNPPAATRHFGKRPIGITPDHGPDLETLGAVVDQFVIHYDAAGTSRRCFRVLQEHGLSVHFLLDLDGTLYQTLDLKEAAWHATVANGRSIGIEIANIGAYAVDGRDPSPAWYSTDADGRTRITIPGGPERGGLRDPSLHLVPARDGPVVGEVQGQTLRQYDLTTQQYAALIKLTATLCTLFPRLTCDYPRGTTGRLTTTRLTDEALKGYHGLLGHYHVQADKIDPGPAFQWDHVIHGARALLPR